MGRRMVAGFAPATLPHSIPSRCSRKCCWSPYGHIPREDCTCHPKENE